MTCVIPDTKDDPFVANKVEATYVLLLEMSDGSSSISRKCFFTIKAINMNNVFVAIHGFQRFRSTSTSPPAPSNNPAFNTSSAFTVVSPRIKSVSDNDGKTISFYSPSKLLFVKFDRNVPWDKPFHS